MRKLTSLGFGLALALASGSASAWKIDTHLWLGEQLVKELAASPTIAIAPLALTPLPGRFQVPPQLRNAILANPNAFLLGTLGPDVYPDMIAPQMTTHPGHEAPGGAEAAMLSVVPSTLAAFGRQHTASPNWNTDDWLLHVRGQAKTAPEIAFAYGYLMHAAMDTWAHSYVNQYSGDVFSLTDEQEVEFRHMALETFIKHLHQPFLPDVPATTSKTSNSAVRLASPPPDRLTPMQAPVDFVRRTLLLNQAAANQYGKEQTTLYLWAMHQYWYEVSQLSARAQPMRTQLNSAFNAAQQALRSAQQLHTAAQTSYSTALSLANSAYQKMQQAESAALAATTALAKLEKDILGMFKQFQQITNSLLNMLPPPLRTQYDNAKSALNAARQALNTAKAGYQTQVAQRDLMHGKMQKALGDVNVAKSARDALALAQQQTLQAFDSAAAAWRINIERAVDAYILAWQETSKELVRPHSRRFSYQSDVTEPLKQWVLCWGPSFGLPTGAALSGVCAETRASYLAVTQNLRVLTQNTFIKQPLRGQIEALEALAQYLAGEFLVNVMAKNLSRAIRVDNGQIAGFARSIVNLHAKETLTRAQLDDEFDDNTAPDKPLRIFPKVSALLFEDLGLSSREPQANLDLNALKSFAAMQNSITLSRLTLLDGQGLNAVAAAAWAPRGQPGNFFAPTAAAGEILIGAIRSIDGDHQWQKHAPALPTSLSTVKNPRTFGYDASDKGKGGFRFWQHAEARTAVFNRVFAGPLAPALVRAIGAANLAPGIGLCEADPFPPTGGPDRCRSR